jgi:succinylglutamate desuccinylase
MEQTPLQHITALVDNYAEKCAQFDGLTHEFVDAHLDLHTGIANNPQLFAKPRTFTAHGFNIRCRLRNGKITIRARATKTANKN